MTEIVTGRKLRLAVVANVAAGYRVAQHRRIVRELPEIELLSLFKHEQNYIGKAPDLPAEINPEVLGKGETSTGKNSPSRILKNWKRGVEIIDRLERFAPDAVIMTGYNDLGLLRLLRWCKADRIPVFMFSDSNAKADHASGPALLLKKLYVGWVIRSLTGLMPCGTRGVEFYNRYGGTGKPAFYMPHEGNYELITGVTDEQVRAIRAKYGLREDRKYINDCARIVKVKRPDLMLEAFAKIADERPDWDLLMVGGGDLLEETKASVPEQLKDRVVFTGHVDGADKVAALYRASHMLCLPSSWEPWAAVLPEAAAARIAIVASDVVGAAAEMCKPGINGRMFRSGDAEDLASALLEVTDPAQIETFRDGSLEVLRDWRTRGDPVDGVRRALEFAGLLEPRRGEKPTGDPEIDSRADADAGVHALATSAFDARAGAAV